MMPTKPKQFLTWTLESAVDYFLHVAAVELSAFDGVERHVGPEDEFARVVEVERDGVLESVQDGRVLLAIGQHLADVDSVREDQHRLSTC